MSREIEVKENRGFKGVWLPKELYLNKYLSWSEKMLLVEINSLHCNCGSCFASNKHFAEFLGVCDRAVEKMIAKLKREGYIQYKTEWVHDGYGGKKRTMWLTDPETYTNRVTEKKFGKVTEQKFGKVTEKKFGISNTDITIQEKESNDMQYIESDKSDSTKRGESDMKDFPDIECKVWEWKSENQYIGYIERQLPKLVGKKAALWEHKSDSAYKVFLAIISYFFRQYRIYNNKFHPWYKYETISEVIDGLFECFGTLNVEEVKEYIDAYFQHDSLRSKPMKVFVSENVMKYLRGEVECDWSGVYEDM